MDLHFAVTHFRNSLLGVTYYSILRKGWEESETLILLPFDGSWVGFLQGSEPGHVFRVSGHETRFSVLGYHWEHLRGHLGRHKTRHILWNQRVTSPQVIAYFQSHKVSPWSSLASQQG